MEACRSRHLQHYRGNGLGRFNESSPFKRQPSTIGGYNRGEFPVM
jgi:hypothetical protein